MKHKRRFEEIFKEKYEGIINQAHADKGTKMRLKVLEDERRRENHYSKMVH